MTTKIIRGYLLDDTTKEIIDQGTVELSIIPSRTPDDRPSLMGIFRVDGVKLEYEQKTFILKLREDISGRVRLLIGIGFIKGFQTTDYHIEFLDSFWLTILDWFESL